MFGNVAGTSSVEYCLPGIIEYPTMPPSDVGGNEFTTATEGIPDARKAALFGRNTVNNFVESLN